MKVKEAIIIASSVVTILGGIGAFLREFGHELDGFALLMADNSWWLFPMATFVLGLMIGRSLNEWKAKRTSLNNSGQKKYSFDERVQIFKQEPCGKKKALSAYLYNLPDHRAIISENGAFKIQEFERPYRHYLDRKKFYSFDARGGDSVYIELEEWIINLFEKEPELLEEFPPIALDEISILFDQNEPNVRGLIYLD